MNLLERLISTSQILLNWEGQSTAAERLSADILRLEGFQGIDPQSPLGGRDDGKDILCSKDGVTFVAACYFPHSALAFARTQKKFGEDLAASVKHARDGLIFLTNQKLTPGQRTELEVRAAKEGKRCLIFHREHLRIVLDSPQGYAVRLRHLGISMSVEEQAAYFASSGESLAAALVINTRAIDRLAERVSQIAKANTAFIMESVAVVVDAVRSDTPSGDVARMLQTSADALLGREVTEPSDGLSAGLSTPLLRYVHRLLLPGDPTFAGRYRQTQVWLADPTGLINEDIECPSWDKVPLLMEELVDGWKREFARVAAAGSEAASTAMASFFHRLVQIHPFIDGNGRLARSILALQGRDLMKLSEDLRLDRGRAYYSALRCADGGDLQPLKELIELAADDAA